MWTRRTNLCLIIGSVLVTVALYAWTRLTAGTGIPCPSPTERSPRKFQQTDDLKELYPQTDDLKERYPQTDDLKELYPQTGGIKEHPGIVSNPTYKLTEFVTIGKGRFRTIGDLSDGVAEDRFFALMEMTHIECVDVGRMGNVGDGGWDVCLSQPYTPVMNQCLVYSFGIGFDFSFDDAFAKCYGCQVMSFDPSMKIDTHQRSANVMFYNMGLEGSNIEHNGWTLMTLGGILQKFNHTETIIDGLKMDIEYSEWASVETMCNQGVLSNVKQLIMEIHTAVFDIGKQFYYEMYNILLELEKLGFRRFRWRQNSTCKAKSVITGKIIYYCYEISYININYLTQ